jgi:hypothetical protein
MSAAGLMLPLPSVASSGHISTAATPAACAGAGALTKSGETLESQRFYARLTKEPDVGTFQAYRHRRILSNVEVCTQVEYSRLDAATQATFKSFYDLGFSEKETQHYSRKLRKGAEHIMKMRESQVLVGPLYEVSRFSAHPVVSAYWTAESALDELFDDLRELHEELHCIFDEEEHLEM